MLTRIKYPRTCHLPYSLTVSDDDKRLSSDRQFKEMDEVVVTVKMDGENTTVYPDGYIHARSLDGNRNPWQTWLKTNIQNWAYDIPEGWRVCGENLYARHSIAYHFDHPAQYFQVFGIYDDENVCRGWLETMQLCECLGVEHVTPIYYGKYDKDAILNEFAEFSKNQKDEVEGFVIRNSGSFPYDDFSKNVGKYVRANHIRTDEHWTEHWTSNEVKWLIEDNEDENEKE